MSREEHTDESTRQIWAPLINEIKSLGDAICVLDNDETKCVDILIKHVERIQKAIPPKTVSMQYPKPIHRILSIRPLKRIEIPLDVLDILVSSGFAVNEYYNNDGVSYPDRRHTTNKKFTCLHLALRNHHYNAARWLVKHDADCNKRSYEELPYSFMHKNPYISPMTMLACQRNAPLDLFTEIKTTRNLNNINNPLHVAVQFGHIDIALHLMELGADVNCVSWGLLPLHIAVEHGHTELALLLITYEASVNRTDGFGDLPLHIAVKNGHTEFVLLLIKHGASVNQHGRSGDTPLHIAVKNGYTELILFLIKQGVSVRQSNGYGFLPVTCYVDKVSGDTKPFNEKILTKLIPGSNMDILQLICEIFEVKDLSQWNNWTERKVELLSDMINKLIQHLTLDEPLSVTIKWKYSDHFEMKINQHAIIGCKSVKTVYLCSVLLVLLRCNILVVNADVPKSPFHLFTPTDTQKENVGLLLAHATVDVLNAYKQKTTIRKLQTLCIWRTRQSMDSPSDESFQSLPVLRHLQKMLMLQDSADILFAGYKMWPKRMSIEVLM